MQGCGRQAKCTPIPVPCTLLCYKFVQLFLSFLALALSLCPHISCLFLVDFGLLYLSILAAWPQSWEEVAPSAVQPAITLYNGRPPEYDWC